MDQLPDDFAAPIGRIVHYGGHAEAYLNQLLANASEVAAPLGLSGERLISSIRKKLPGAPELDRVLNGYSELYEWRNILIHSSYRYADGALWIWRQPIRGKGQTSFSYTLKLPNLLGLCESWHNLAEAAHDLLHPVLAEEM
ncbi:hypothetical protein [Nocardia nova]|uniref:hypothetical protein n=1 Tax=Nocardia nova TaxID=37330 RepID=UPI00273A4702|nr:hypothetical protein [Nocardia nova]